MRKLIYFILLAALIHYDNTYTYMTNNQIEKRFELNNNSPTNFFNYSNTIKYYIRVGKMGTYDSLKCTLKSKRNFTLFGKIPVTEYSVSDCSITKFGVWKKLYVNTVLTIGSGINHRFSGARPGENIFFPRVAFFYGSLYTGFVY